MNEYTNSETFHASLWLDNDRATSEYWNAQAEALLDSDAETALADLTDMLEEHYTENYPLQDESNLYSELLGIALHSVNWRELAETFIESILEG